MSFAFAHFDTSKQLAVITDNTCLPANNTLCFMRCHRCSTEPSNDINDYITTSVSVNTSGSIKQGFNSEGTATGWSGDIFGCYKIK